MAAQAEQSFKKKVHGTNQISDFFSELESQRFPEEMVREHYPEAFARWVQLGHTQSTPWQWVMMLELCMVAFLAPTAALRPIPSITIYAVLWVFFVHPGSTSTSNLLRLYGDALDEIEDRAREDRARRRDEWRQAQGKGAGNGGKGNAPSNPFAGQQARAWCLVLVLFLSFCFLCRFHLRQFFCAGDLSVTLSAGSLEGEGRVMSQPQNLCRSVGFIPEGKRFLRWLQAEGSINEAIATELYERAKWKRNTIHEDRSFEIKYPFFAAAGALHVPDLASIFTDGDPLGIKGRLSFMYTRPAFDHAAEIRAANQQINQAGTLVEDLATFFWPCHTTHDPVWAGLDRFHKQKGYPFRFYTLTPDAAAFFDENFDQHVEGQKAAHLNDQEKAKFHGKAKTKHLRLALALHLHGQTLARRTQETWEATVESKHLAVAEEIGKYMDMITARLSDFFGFVMSATGPGPKSPATPSTAKLTARQQLDQVLHGAWASFEGLPVDKQVTFWQLAQLALLSSAVWIENAAFARQTAVQQLLPNVGENGVARLACLLRHLGLVTVVKGINTHGTPLFYMVKRNLAPAMPLFNVWSNVLQEFEVGLHAYKTFPPETVAQHKPAKAGAEPVFDDFDETTLRPRLVLVQAWRRAVHASAAAGALPAQGAAAPGRARTLN